MENIIGRKKEIQILDKIVASNKSEFVALYGRRRVGKTYLVREYFNYNFDFQLIGLANANTQQQLLNFHVGLNRQVQRESDSPPKNWFMAFQRLMDYLESKPTQQKKIIFLDELPWLDTPRSDFLISLEHFWNSWATNRRDIILITCGSAASWMINELINNHGGLHNRVTQRMKIHPFNLHETELMLKSKSNVLDRYQILLLYMAMGGIPYYLDAVSSNKSAAQNIEEMCFTAGGFLTTEFQNLFASLFRNASKHETIIFALSSKKKGLTRKEISKLTGIKSGGTMTTLLNELEESGFISRYTQFNKKSSNMLYRLSDFYSLFYLRFIKDKRTDFENVWISALDSPAQRAWTGYAFEQVCMAHIPQIKKALGVAAIQTKASSWRSKASDPGAQIDLVIDRRDQVINLCELKFSINPFSISKSYAENLRNKVSSFRDETQTRKALFLTFVSTYGLTQNPYTTALVQNDISMDALFEA